jgi:hypothetical protein
VQAVVAPLSGKINADQALKFAESIARGERDATDIIKDARQSKRVNLKRAAFYWLWGGRAGLQARVTVR